MPTRQYQSLHRFASALETATSRPVGPAQINAARAVSAGHVLVVDSADSLLVAGLAAALAAADGRVHLATATVEEADRLAAGFSTLGLDQIVCASAEAFVFDHLRGKNDETVLAIIASAELTLLRDGQVPVIIACVGAPSQGDVSADAIAEADRLLLRDRDYVISDGGIVVRDAETGDLFPGRKFCGELRAAIQKREGVTIEPDDEIVAQTTAGDYFRRYPKLAAVSTTDSARYQEEYALSS